MLMFASLSMNSLRHTGRERERESKTSTLALCQIRSDSFEDAQQPLTFWRGLLFVSTSSPVIFQMFHFDYFQFFLCTLAMGGHTKYLHPSVSY